MFACHWNLNSTYPTIVVFMEEPHQLTSAECHFIFHGWFEVELDTVDVAWGRTACHCSRSDGIHAKLGPRRTRHRSGRRRSLGAQIERLWRIILPPSHSSCSKSSTSGTNGAYSSRLTFRCGRANSKRSGDRGVIWHGAVDVCGPLHRLGMITKWVARIVCLVWNH